MSTLQRIYYRLWEYYGPQGWWPAESVFEMMVGAILVQRTNWNNVEQALRRLTPYLTPEKIARMSIEELESAIRPSGFYRQKAKRLKAFVHWYKTYDYKPGKLRHAETDTLRTELMGIHGIGAETANVLLLYAFDHPVFVVDAYARRIFARFGLDIPEKEPAFRIQVESECRLNTEGFKEFHALIVQHAKEHCKMKPICSGCPLLADCQQVGVK
ncbi:MULTISPECIES: endonuclease [Clostridia]|uniref:endonuclease III domain-containing protein n=1 Tax=Clostridia TaxID=186801 RepID=UPI000EA2ECE5|nr:MULTISPECIES: endonuclease [Clostridia]NBJ70058.1 endonuclease [Roseburia sp. 1XD42-34]RKI77232.1 endonuclease [Clostridium sp. 1xD42-85]